MLGVGGQAVLLHLHSRWMVDDGRPARAAAVATPIQRLWVLYLEVSYPPLSRTFKMALMALEVSGRPVWK